MIEDGKGLDRDQGYLEGIKNFRGIPLKTEVRFLLNRYNPDRSKGRLGSPSQEELSRDTRAAVPFGENYPVPKIIKEHCDEFQLQLVFQLMLNELFNRVNVIEIDGPRGSGKGSQVSLLRDFLVKRGMITEIAKVSGFIDPNNPLEEVYFAGIDQKVRKPIEELHRSRKQAKERTFTPYSSVEEAIEDMPRSVFNFFAQLDFGDEKEQLRNLNMGKRFYFESNQAVIGELAWEYLQYILIGKMNRLLEIADKQKADKAVITDGGRMTRLYMSAKYLDTFSTPNLFEINFPLPDTWTKYIMEHSKAGIKDDVVLPLPRKVVVLEAGEDVLIERVRNDQNKTEEESEGRIVSIKGNAGAFYETAAEFKKNFPDTVEFVNSEKSMEEVARDISDIALSVWA